MNKKNIILIFLTIILSIILTLILYFIFFNHYNNVRSNIIPYSSISSIEANSNNIKTTPNTTITFITNYLKCNHFKKSISNIPLKFVNLTKKEFLLNYSDWTLIDFSPNNIKLIKTINEFCNEHFFIKSSTDGFISIYIINPNGSKTLKEKTKIAIKFLSKDDIKELTNGKEIYGYNNLNAYIENFE